MPRLTPSYSGSHIGRDRTIGKKIGSNLGGILGGIALANTPKIEETTGSPVEETPYGSEDEFGGSGESTPTPTSQTLPYSATTVKYPTYKYPTGMQKFSDIMSGGRYSQQIAQLNQQSALAQAEDQSKVALEGIKSLNEQDLAILKQSLDVATALQIPWSKELMNQIREYNVVTQPGATPGNLLEQRLLAEAEKQAELNKQVQANVTKATAEGLEAQNRAAALAAKQPFIPASEEADILGKKATTRKTTAEAEQAERLASFGYLGLPRQFMLTPGKIPAEARIGSFTEPTEGYTDWSGKMPTRVPGTPGGLVLQPFSPTVQPTPAPTNTNTWEDSEYIYRRLPSGQVQRKKK